MKATITYVTRRTEGTIKTKVIEDFCKMETIFTNTAGKIYEEVRFYTSDWNWFTFVKDGIINVFIEV